VAPGESGEERDVPQDDDDYSEEERSAQVRRTLLVVLGVLVALGIVVALGTSLMVRSLGLDEQDTGPLGSGTSPRAPLPTTALPVPGQSPSDQPTDLTTPKQPTKGEIQLNVSPLAARPMERVNLTGTYQGQDNLQLQVQRFEDGQWRNFGVDATVRVGTFETYVMTGREGENRFRMYDDKAGKGSNVVLVTIG
jgi:hypothetical protein